MPSRVLNVFVSHKATHKKKARKLKDALHYFGVESFLAHEDIEPTRQWEDEIINALQRADVLIALLTPDFRESDWTDQEIGAAVGRGIPVIPVSLGLTPYGFAARFQTIDLTRVDMEHAAEQIVTGLLRRESRDVRGLITNSFVVGMHRVDSFSSGEQLAKIVPLLRDLSDDQVAAIVQQYNANRQVNGSGHFDGLADHLTRMTDRAFKLIPKRWESEIRERDPIFDLS